MQRIRLKLNKEEMLDLCTGIERFCIPGHIFALRKDVRLYLASLVLMELAVKLNRKLLGVSAIKSYTFTPAECLAFQIAYLAGLRCQWTMIDYHLFEEVDKRML
jgi:hypothetical protein